MNRIDVDTSHRIWNAWISRANCKSELLNPCDLVRMVEDELEKRNHPCRVFVKDLFIANGTDYDKVWIGNLQTLEGGDFSKDKFYEALADFYDEEF